MHIEYTYHAKIRMNDRGVEEDDVEYILKYPFFVRKSFQDRLIAVGKWNRRPIKM